MPSAPEPREAVRRMAPYSPPLERRGSKLRLDFNENLSGCSPAVLQVLRDGATRGFVATYPEYGEVRRRLGDHLGVEAEQLTLGAGSDEAISAVLHAYVDPGDEVVIPTPSFSMLKFYTELLGGKPVMVPFRRPDLAFPAREIAGAVGPATRAVCIASPNNPTGGALTRDQAERILEAADGRAVLFDEAYFEFHGETVLDLLPKWPNLFVARTFSKAYGMAGLRIGVLVSQADNIAVVRKGQSPYSVNSLAARCAMAAIADRDYVRSYVRQVLEARELLCGAFDEMGVRHWPSRGNFVLFEIGSDSRRICAAIAGQGILIRDQSAAVPGAARVTLGPLQETVRFLAVFREVTGR